MKGVDGASGGSWRSMILGLSSPLTQRYVFLHYVLGEPRLDALAVAAAAQQYGPMDEREYDLVAERWAAS